jgi:hypothetical protein
MSGTYVIGVSHQGSHDTGGYEVGLQCLYGPCPVPPPSVPICDITLNGDTFTAGDTVSVVSWRLANPGEEPVAVELKAWIEGPGIGAFSFFNFGADGSLVLPPGFDVDLGSFPILPVSPLHPGGFWEFSCSMVHPVTGRPQTLDRNTFEIVIP